MSADPGTDAVFGVTLPPGPYPGLRPFEQAEWTIFFGRERMADAVVAQLIERHVLVVHGDSGCGKSSLVRAAVLPRLEQGCARGGVRWLTCAALPREAPLWNLAEALAGVNRPERDEAAVIEMRRALNLGAQAPAAVAALLVRRPGDPLCILIDQFEELFAHARRHGPGEARLLTEFLVALHATPTDELYAVLTMRSEFLGACARYAGFAELVNATQYLLPRMDTNDLRRAIREPAELFDGQVSFDLAERLIADAGGGQDQLPLIQHGLMLLQRGPAARGGRWQLDRASFPANSGLAGLLSDHADEVMRASGADPGLAEAVFRALTEINAEGQAVRRPQTLAQLVRAAGGDDTGVRRVVDAFRADGVSFLKPYAGEPLDADTLVDISHEALIRCWRRLAEPKDGWLAREFRSGLVWRALIVQAEGFEQDPANVLGPVATDERERWLRTRNPAWAERYGGGWPRVQALIAASVAARDRERAEQEEAQRLEQEAARRERRLKTLRAGAIVLGAFLVIASALGVLALQQSRRAGDEAQRASAEAADAHRARLQKEAELEEARRQFDRLQAEVARREALQQQTAQSAQKLNEVVQELDRAVATGAPNAAWRQSVNAAKNAVSAQAGSLAKASGAPPPGNEGSNPPPPSPDGAALPPRIYVQIADESQRAAAQRLVKALLAAPTGGERLQLPGIELVKTATRSSVLRCFRPQDCERDGPRLVRLVNGLLAAPQITLEDQSSRYGRATNIRDRHFELWFAPGPIRLQGS